MEWERPETPAFCPPSSTIQCTFLFLNATTTTIDGTSAPGMHACGSKESRRAFDFLCDFPSCSLQLARVAPVTSQLCDGRLACYRKLRTTERKSPFFSQRQCLDYFSCVHFFAGAETTFSPQKEKVGRERSGRRRSKQASMH